MRCSQRELLASLAALELANTVLAGYHHRMIEQTVRPTFDERESLVSRTSSA